MPPQFPLATVGALVTAPDGRVLIVKTTKWRGTWGVPGGKVEWGERLETALKREFQEEVGLDLLDIEFALVQEAVNDPQFHCPAHFVLLNYYARCESTVVVPNEEIVEWQWLTPQEALSFPLNSFTKLLLEDYQIRFNLLKKII
ncbi:MULTISPECIES: NUDIX domain-containing protein [unclassified Synechocystis]|uniref:NUDIX domain-containing protein n=1 Tax=unclassified Synechocystis TaxID=2640012 RepID=UPI0004286D71|nr:MULTISPECIES: NUDIX domain-containing protein [unclassified Synechocystis]AIE75231.1 Dihydroneopterin triphosphate pyrophosphohydolase [Synechocystis sp. PCC 6714]MCT0252979.1 NUDIX domain-containing protein [Synechocystis sp. CS-94]